MQALQEQVDEDDQPEQRDNGDPFEPFVRNRQVVAAHKIVERAQVGQCRDGKEQQVEQFAPPAQPHRKRERAHRQECGTAHERQLHLQQLAHLVAPAERVLVTHPHRRNSAAAASQAIDANQHRARRRRVGRRVQRHKQGLVVAVVHGAALRLVEQHAVAVHRNAAQGLPTRQVEKARLCCRWRQAGQLDAVPIGDGVHTARRRGNQFALGRVRQADFQPSVDRQPGFLDASRRGRITRTRDGQQLGPRDVDGAIGLPRCRIRTPAAAWRSHMARPATAPRPTRPSADGSCGGGWSRDASAESVVRYH